MIKRLFAIFVFLFSNGSIAQDTTALFEQANQHYNEGAYTEAVKNYKAILATDQHSTELYFNLGNSYYKLNKVAESIYYYEKALQLQPDDPDVLHNIQFAQNMTLDAIETLPQTQLASVKQQLLQQISLQQWSYAIIVCIWLALLFFALYIISRSPLRKRLAFIAMLLTLFVGGGSFIGANASLDQKENVQYGILFSEEIQLYDEPNARSEVAFLLHQGAKVQILDSLQDWQKIRIANGAEGWVKGAAIRAL